MTADALQPHGTPTTYTAQDGPAFPAIAEAALVPLHIPARLNIEPAPPPRAMPDLRTAPPIGYRSGEQSFLHHPDNRTRIVARADVSTGTHPANVARDPISNPRIARPPTYLQGSLRAEAGPLVAELTRSAGEGTKPRKSDSYSIGASGSTAFGSARAVISGALPTKGVRETPTAALTIDNACSTGAMCLSLDLSAPMSKTGLRKPAVSIGTQHPLHDDGHSSIHVGTSISKDTSSHETSVYLKARF